MFCADRRNLGCIGVPDCPVRPIPDNKLGATQKLQQSTRHRREKTTSATETTVARYGSPMKSSTEIVHGGGWVKRQFVRQAQGVDLHLRFGHLARCCRLCLNPALGGRAIRLVVRLSNSQLEPVFVVTALVFWLIEPPTDGYPLAIQSRLRWAEPLLKENVHVWGKGGAFYYFQENQKVPLHSTRPAA